MLTVKQVAERLGVAESTVYKFVQNGTIPGFKIGKCVRIDSDTLDAYIESRRMKSVGQDTDLSKSASEASQ